MQRRPSGVKAWQASLSTVICKFAPTAANSCCNAVTYSLGDSAGEYYRAVGGPKEQHRYFTSHEFNDFQSARDRRDWLTKELGLHDSSRDRLTANDLFP